MRSRGFTLLEVLLSVLILFTMGLALLKFDGWIKEDVARYRDKAILLYQSTPLLFQDIHRIGRDSVNMFDATRFSKLRDDEIFWLKGIKARADIGKSQKKTLFQTGDLDLSYRLYPLRIENDTSSVGFLRIEP
jgi:hypothetical protein